MSQPWAYRASTPLVAKLLSTGTVCYSMYANPKSGNQGSIFRDGRMAGWDMHADGGSVSATDPPEEILRSHLYRHEAVAYCCAYAGVQPADARAVTGRRTDGCGCRLATNGPGATDPACSAGSSAGGPATSCPAAVPCAVARRPQGGGG